MSDSPPEFVITGTTSETSQWARAARQSGILWCDRHERDGGPQCDGVCRRNAFCGIGEDQLELKIIPIESGPGLTKQSEHPYLLLTPSKKLTAEEQCNTRRLVPILMSGFGACETQVLEYVSDEEGSGQWRAAPRR